MNFFNKRVDSGNKGFRGTLSIRTICRPLPLDTSSVKEHTCGSILSNVVRSKIPGKQTQTAFSPQVDLPKAVSRRVVTLQEKRITGASRVDVWDAPLIKNDLGRIFKSCDGLRNLPNSRRHLRLSRH